MLFSSAAAARLSSLSRSEEDCPSLIRCYSDGCFDSQKFLLMRNKRSATSRTSMAGTWTGPNCRPHVTAQMMLRRLCGRGGRGQGAPTASYLPGAMRKESWRRYHLLSPCDTICTFPVPIRATNDSKKSSGDVSACPIKVFLSSRRTPTQTTGFLGRHALTRPKRIRSLSSYSFWVPFGTLDAG